MDTSEMIVLSREFAALGKELLGSEDHSATLLRIPQTAVKHIDPCTAASVTVLHGRTLLTLAASDDAAVCVDEMQTRTGEGPWFALTGRATYLFANITDRRWPALGAALAAESAVHSMLCLRLIACHGWLNLYAEQPDAYGPEETELAIVLAGLASNLVALHEVANIADGLRAALQTSREIGAAVGVLMALRKVARGAAFALLRTASQNLHRKLRDVAAQVVETGTLPGLPGGGADSPLGAGRAGVCV